MRRINLQKISKFFTCKNINSINNYELQDRVTGGLYEDGSEISDLGGFLVGGSCV